MESAMLYKVTLLRNTISAGELKHGQNVPYRITMNLYIKCPLPSFSKTNMNELVSFEALPILHSRIKELLSWWRKKDFWWSAYTKHNALRASPDRPWRRETTDTSGNASWRESVSQSRKYANVGCADLQTKGRTPQQCLQTDDAWECDCGSTRERGTRARVTHTHKHVEHVLQRLKSWLRKRWKSSPDSLQTQKQICADLCNIRGLSQ